jgi:nucleotide-binding universal stress UspA family protein
MVGDELEGVMVMPRTRIRRPVVVGVDGTDDGLRAAVFAAHEASARGVGLEIFHMYRAYTAVNPMLAMNEAEGLRESGESVIAETVGEVKKQGLDVGLSTSVVLGNPSAVLVEASRHACLVVLGRSGLSGFERIFAGSTSIAVAARSKCPVVVTPAGWQQEFGIGPIVVGVDGSRRGHAALALGLEYASRMQTPLVALQVWETPNWWTVDDRDITAGAATGVERARLVLAEELAGAGEDYPDVHVVLESLQGRPADALVARASGAALLVIGARGRGGVPGLQLGSIARAVLAHAPCPVIVVRPRDQSRAKGHAFRAAASESPIGVGWLGP